MAPRRSAGATEIARENADVFRTVARWSLRLLPPYLLVSYLAALLVGWHADTLVTPVLWLRLLASGDTLASLGHLAVLVGALLVGVLLETLFFCRAAFASSEPCPLAEVRAAARRLVRGVRRALLVALGAASPRPAPRPDADVEHGILGQLRRALSISPLAPPLALTPVADLLGPARPSGHRAEVAAHP